MNRVIHRVMSSVKAVTVRKLVKINLLQQGKAKNLLKTTILVYVVFIKVSQNDNF